MTSTVMLSLTWPRRVDANSSIAAMSFIAAMLCAPSPARRNTSGTLLDVHRRAGEAEGVRAVDAHQHLGRVAAGRQSVEGLDDVHRLRRVGARGVDGDPLVLERDDAAAGVDV